MKIGNSQARLIAYTQACFIDCFRQTSPPAPIGRVLPHDKWNPAVSSRPQTDVTRLRKVTLNAVVTGRRPKEGEHLRSSSEL